jgi:hypothetical protein
VNIYGRYPKGLSKSARDAAYMLRHALFWDADKADNWHYVRCEFFWALVLLYEVFNRKRGVASLMKWMCRNGGWNVHTMRKVWGIPE